MSSSNESFASPTGNEASDSDEVAATQEFEPPPEQADQDSQAAYVPDANALGMGGPPTQLVDAHAQIAAALKEQVPSGRAQTFSIESDTPQNVQAVAIGLGEPGDGGVPGEPVLTVFVEAATDTAAVRAAVVDAFGVEGAADVPLAVRVSGQFEALAQNERIRPCPCGLSVGHFKVTAGTLGALSVGRAAPRNNRLLVLSNNHVLANSNNATYGDNIIQPGRVDGGNNPADRIAILERFVPIRFGGPTNYVDCATGWAWPDRVRREQAYKTSTGYQLFRTGNAPQYPALGDIVGKTGRTTQLTQGRVTQLNWAGWIGPYPGVGSAFFAGQFIVTGNFSAGGDSGSLIWKWRSGLPPTGLLFAGGGGYTIANPLPWVTYYLDVNLYT